MFHFHGDEDYSINPVSAELKGLSDREQFSAKPIKATTRNGGDLDNGDLVDRLAARHAREHADEPEAAEMAVSWVGPPSLRVVRPAWQQARDKKSA